jgi:DNA modification methylase
MLEHDKIYNLDCFTATTELPDQSVDVVLTDPPYPNRMNLFPDTQESPCECHPREQ